MSEDFFANDVYKYKSVDETARSNKLKRIRERSAARQRAKRALADNPEKFTRSREGEIVPKKMMAEVNEAIPLQDIMIKCFNCHEIIRWGSSEDPERHSTVCEACKELPSEVNAPAEHIAQLKAMEADGSAGSLPAVCHNCGEVRSTCGCVLCPGCAEPVKNLDDCCGFLTYDHPDDTCHGCGSYVRNCTCVGRKLARETKQDTSSKDEEEDEF